jgi:DtxR family transcriptional regulator, Mn-dependent transcriptional regulator
MLTLTPTLEDYLEAIFHLVQNQTVARSMDIADKLDVKRSSVTVALRSLAEKGLIDYEARSFITLTDKGLQAARCVDKRHHILHEMFTKVLRLPDDEANKAACAMEHGMSSTVCRKLTALLMAVNADPAEAKNLSDKIDSFAEKIDCASDCQYTGSSDMSTDPLAELYDLNSLAPGESGVISRIGGTGTLKKRFHEMGITSGQQITVVRAAPLNDPIQIKVRHFNLSLRREEAAQIFLKKE